MKRPFIVIQTVPESDDVIRTLIEELSEVV